MNISKEAFFKRRTKISCCRVFIESIISMSFSKAIFDSLFTGLILYQIYNIFSTLVNTTWNAYLVKDRTVNIELQRKFLSKYNIIKYIGVTIYVVNSIIIIITGFKYLFPILFFELILIPANSLINSIESRVQTIIMDSHSFEDNNFISSKTSLYTSIASMAGMGVSSLILYILNIGAFPISVCMSLANIVLIIDELEMSRYINLIMDKLIDYYDEKYEELSNKTLYNETKSDNMIRKEV